jgi:hypothetical protein
MVSKFNALLFLVLPLVCFGQALPDRDELVAKMLQPATADQGAAELIKHYQLGGIRTLVRQMNDMPQEQRMRYGMGLRHLDLFRYRNDLNANLANAPDNESKAMWLMLLSTFGRQLAPEVFESYINDASLPLYVRLTACTGLIQVQKPSNYERFIELAEEALVDPYTGQNDLAFCDLDQKNIGFFLYTKAKLENDPPYGAVIASIEMARSGNKDIYENILDLRQKKYLPQMIDRAIRAGAPDLLDLMLEHRTSRRKDGEINRAKPLATEIAKYRDKLNMTRDTANFPLGPFFYVNPDGKSASEDFRAAYGVVKIDATGAISLLYHQRLFDGGNDNLQSLLQGKSTLPAYSNWQPIETYALVYAP